MIACPGWGPWWNALRFSTLRPLTRTEGGERTTRAWARVALDCTGRNYLGRLLLPIRKASTSRAHWRPSRIAHTTSDWPRRMSPAANTLGTLVA